MQRIIKHIIFLVLSIYVVVFSSCVKNESCLSANNLLVTDFYTVNQDSEIVKYNIDSLTMYIIGREDTILYDNEKNLGSFNIPMADTAQQLKILLTLNSVHDTIWVDYRPYEVFRSTHCGVINRYEIKNVTYTKNSIWQIYMNNNQIDESKNTNFFMFYRTH